MTGMERVPMGPPWSVDLIADLHAGVLPPEVAAQLRPRVEADPESREILAALDATLADLHSLPVIPMPDHVAARIDAALAAEARPAAPVVSLAEARKRRNRRLGLGSGVLVAAAAAFGIVFAVSPDGKQAEHSWRRRCRTDADELERLRAARRRRAQSWAPRSATCSRRRTTARWRPRIASRAV